jgi:hypothetical protein
VRAIGASGSKCPAPPANVNRILTGVRRYGPERAEQRTEEHMQSDRETHGDFAEGEETLPPDEHEGSFAEGEETEPEDKRRGSFAEGEETEPRDEREGSFADREED